MRRSLSFLASPYLILGVLFAIGAGGLAIRGCRDRDKVGVRAVATQKVAEALPAYDSLKRVLAERELALTRTQASLHEIASRPPVVVTKVVKVEGVDFVPQADFDRMSHRADSLRTMALALSDTLDSYRKIPPQIVAAADTVIKYQRVLIEVPAPRRRWGFGCVAGGGVTEAGGKITAGPSATCGVSYSL